MPPTRTPQFVDFPSRRSVVHSTEGIVACTQPLAAKCGLEILRKGGNCADAAVAVAAGLNMAEPCSTGIGGDMFCLFYSAATKQVSALNGSGRAGGACTLEQIRADLGLADGQPGAIPMSSVHAATVPGAAAGWCDTVERFGSGKLSMAEILAPAIEMGEKGFPVSQVAAYSWNKAEASLRAASPNFAEMLKADPAAPDGCRAPRAGELMFNPTLARTFRTLATEGKAGFYTGRIAEEIIKVCNDLGGHQTLDDLAHHLALGSEPVDPISLRFTGQGLGDDEALTVWEHPPNGQGIVALIALGLLQEFERAGKIPHFTPADHNSPAYLHAVIEALRIAFADAAWYVTDPNVKRVPTAGLLSPDYLAARAKLFSPDRTTGVVAHGSPALSSSDTVYFAVTDRHGNGISFINSNYAGFGTGIIPAGCGFTLQNRGANFALDATHPNALAPRKRPYHTIIPALTTRPDGSLHSVFGVMGGFMQPQGHVQVLLNQAVFGLDAQAALDAPRVCLSSGSTGGEVDLTVALEEGVGEETHRGLKERGHKVQVVEGWRRGMFGKGQVIGVREEGGVRVFSAGSDMRGDGAAVPA